MKVLVLASGGVDSSTALAMAVKEYGSANVTALSLMYGQKHDKELEAAKKVADHYGVEQHFLDLSLVFKDSSSSLLKGTDEDIPKGSYGEQISGSSDGNTGEKGDPDSLISTYVPFRNGLFLSVAASIAQAKGCEKVIYAIHSDDAAGAAYPDCTPEFNEAMKKSIWEGTGHEVTIEAPFVDMTKSDIVKTGLALGVPYELTWSCYEGGEKPCGECGTCIDRAKAFADNGAEDPALS